MGAAGFAWGPWVAGAWGLRGWWKILQLLRGHDGNLALLLGRGANKLVLMRSCCSRPGRSDGPLRKQGISSLVLTLSLCSGDPSVGLIFLIAGTERLISQLLGGSCWILLLLVQTRRLEGGLNSACVRSF